MANLSAGGVLGGSWVGVSGEVCPGQGFRLAGVPGTGLQRGVAWAVLPCGRSEGCAMDGELKMRVKAWAGLWAGGCVLGGT